MSAFCNICIKNVENSDFFLYYANLEKTSEYKINLPALELRMGC